MIAIISDVHANLEAFRAVLADIRSKGIDEILSLGDLVGYGPNPIECILLAMKHGVRSVMGNHEVAIFKKNTRFNPKAQRALDFTRKMVRNYSKDPRVSKFFKDLREEIREERVVFIHGSPRGSTQEYLIKQADLFGLTPKVKDDIRANFDLIDELGFTGHTHIPCICTTEFYLVHPAWSDYAAYPLLWGTKTLVNAGSVGQPRDEDPRACYVTFDGDREVTHHRVEYDIDKTVARFNKNDELDASLGQRLRNGY
jgi:predicted phosphodiesterase